MDRKEGREHSPTARKIDVVVAHTRHRHAPGHFMGGRGQFMGAMDRKQKGEHSRSARKIEVVVAPHEQARTRSIPLGPWTHTLQEVGSLVSQHAAKHAQRQLHGAMDSRAKRRALTICDKDQEIVALHSAGTHTVSPWGPWIRGTERRALTYCDKDRSGCWGTRQHARGQFKGAMDRDGKRA